MTEKERILNFNNGETPDGNYDIVRIKGISQPLEELNIFKQTIVAFLDNKELNEESIKWEILLPLKLVKFTNQLEEIDYHNDDLLSHIPAMINDLKDSETKEWEWHSSKLLSDGFEVIMKGIFRGIYLPLLHHQGIPHKSMFIERNGTEYPTEAMTDIFTYKTFDPVSFELKKK